MKKLQSNDFTIKNVNSKWNGSGSPVHISDDMLNFEYNFLKNYSSYRLKIYLYEK